MVSIACKDCHWTAYTINGATWRTSGTVKRYPSLYCDSCCGDSYSSLSYSGNIVKYECQGCSNILYPVEWCDWRARPKTVYYGRCSNCKSAKEIERQRREREERLERERREREARAARLLAAKGKPEYCPEHYSFSCNTWADVNYSIDSYNFVWTKCIINCKAKRHSIYYQPNFNNSSHLSAGYYHQEITQKLSLSKCPQCKQEKATAAAFDNACKSAQTKIDNLSTDMNDIKDMLKQFTSKEAAPESKIDPPEAAPSSIHQIEQKEKEIMDSIQQFQSVKEEIYTSQQENNIAIENIEATPTYISEAELDAAIDTLQNMAQKCAERKEKLHEQINDANSRETELIDQQNKINDEIKDELKKQNGLHDIHKRIDSEKSKLKGFNGAEINAKGDAIKKLNKEFDNLLISMQGKYKDNKERIDELKDCQKRMRKIRAKIKKEKSDCLYLIQLLNDECERISGVTDEAMDKFEEKTNYFLSVTVGLKQDMVEKLIDFDLEDIANLTEDQLVNDYDIDQASLPKLLRGIKKITQTN